MTTHTRSLIPDESRTHLDNLGDMVRAERARRRLSQRGASREIGLQASTIGRVEAGQWPDVSGLIAIARWLGVSLDWFAGNEGAAEQDAYVRGWNDCAAVVSAALTDTKDRT